MKGSNKGEVVAALTSLLAINLLFFAQVLFSDAMLWGNDLVSQFYYWYSYSAKMLKQGLIPLWNPHYYCGTPFLAGMQGSVFYLPNYPLLWLPVHILLKLSQVLHILAASIFMFYLSRYLKMTVLGSLCSAIIYGYSPYMIMRVFYGTPNCTYIFAYIPLLILLFFRLTDSLHMRDAIGLGILLWLVALAGHPQFLVYIFYLMLALVLVYSLCHGLLKGSVNALRLFCYGIGALIFGLLLSSIQILPSLEVTLHSTRSEGLNKLLSVKESLSPSNLLLAMSPFLFGDILKTPYWGSGALQWLFIYISIPGLVLAFIGLFHKKAKRLVWVFILVISLLLSFGELFPFYNLAYRFIPGISIFRIPSRFLIFTVFTLAVLAGQGIELLLHSRVNRKLATAFAISCILIASLMFIISNVSYQDPFSVYLMIEKLSPGGVVQLAKANGISAKKLVESARGCLLSSLRYSAALFLFTGCMLLFIALFFQWRQLAIRALLVLLVADLYYVSSIYILPYPVKGCHLFKPLVEHITPESEPYFRVNFRKERYLDASSRFGYYEVSGYDPVVLSRYLRYMNIAQGEEPAANWIIKRVENYNDYTRFMGLRFIIDKVRAKRDAEKELDPQYWSLKVGDFIIYEDPAYLSKASLFSRAIHASDHHSAMRLLASGDLDIRSTLIIEGLDDVDNVEYDRGWSALVLSRYEPHIIEAKALSKDGGYLLINDVYYPGWEAFINGKAALIYPCQLMFRCLKLPPGEADIRMIYNPFSFRLGAYITLLSLTYLISIIILPSIFVNAVI